MVLRGRRKLLLLFTAFVGPCLATLGCQSGFGPAGQALNGGPGGMYSGGSGLPYATSPGPGAAPFNYPPGVPSPGAPVVQASYQNPGGLLMDPTGQTGKVTPPANGAAAPGALPPVGPDGLPLPPDGPPAFGPCPRELGMVSHPPYTIAPPDILIIDAMRLIPRPPYRVDPLEILLIEVAGTLPNQPIKGPFVVAPDGTINLGFGYGSVRVGGLTLEQIQTAIRTHLGNIIQNPQVSVALAQFRGMQQTRGEHLVRQDGTINLGTYGCVYVAGLTLAQAKNVIEQHLSRWILNPEIAVDVGAYNSKVYYVIADGGGFGQQVFRFPITGNETVLDAIAMIQGLPPVASKHRIWLARPAPPQCGCDQILPIDWMAIVSGASTATNYQLFPGDRIYISADRLIALDNWLAKIFAPIERIFGITLLGNYTVRSFQNNGNNNGAFFGVVGR